VRPLNKSKGKELFKLGYDNFVFFRIYNYLNLLTVPKPQDVHNFLLDVESSSTVFVDVNLSNCYQFFRNFRFFHIPPNPYEVIKLSNPLGSEQNRKVYILQYPYKSVRICKVIKMVGKVVQTKLSEFVDEKMAKHWRIMHKLGIHSVEQLLDLII